MKKLHDMALRQVLKELDTASNSAAVLEDDK
jgi:hypothetical protein